VPTDFSAASDAALDYAITMGHRFGASLHLLHVVDDPFAGAATWGSEVYIASVPAMQDTLVDEAAKKLSVLLARAAAKRVPARSEVRLGRPAELIREVAKREVSDLIVMGTHGRTGMAHVLLGSVAEKMVREAPCPVLTVRGEVPEPVTAEHKALRTRVDPSRVAQEETR
jgi:universal stress protein A